MTSFNLYYLQKAVSPNAVTLEVRALTYEFWEDIIQSITKGIAGLMILPLIIQEK